MVEMSVNRNALPLVQELIERANEFGVRVIKTPIGTTVIDAGIKSRGGILAGRFITEVCLGGYGSASITYADYDGLRLPSICVSTDHPAMATLGAQFAGWSIKVGKYLAMGSGPARALSRKEKKLYERISYKDESEVGIIVLETTKEPPDEVSEYIARECGIEPGKLHVILVPTTSVTASTQISGRIVETGVHKLNEAGFDPKRILHGCGYAPIAPVHPKFVEAMGRTNDMILYGGVTSYVVDHEDDDELSDFVSRSPSSTSRDYGKPFREIFEGAERDFYKIDPRLFAPAVVSVTNVRTGRTFTAGRINVEILRKSIGL